MGRRFALALQSLPRVRIALHPACPVGRPRIAQPGVRNQWSLPSGACQWIGPVELAQWSGPSHCPAVNAAREGTRISGSPLGKVKSAASPDLQPPGTRVPPRGATIIDNPHWSFFPLPVFFVFLSVVFFFLFFCCLPGSDGGYKRGPLPGRMEQQPSGAMEEQQPGATTGSNNRQRRSTHRSDGTTGSNAREQRNNREPQPGITEKPREQQSKGTAGENNRKQQNTHRTGGTYGSSNPQTHRPTGHGATEPPGATIESNGAPTGAAEQPGATIHIPTYPQGHNPQTHIPKGQNRATEDMQRGNLAPLPAYFRFFRYCAFSFTWGAIMAKTFSRRRRKEGRPIAPKREVSDCARARYGGSENSPRFPGKPRR